MAGWSAEIFQKQTNSEQKEISKNVDFNFEFSNVFLAITDEIEAHGAWIHGISCTTHIMMPWFAFSGMYLNYENVMKRNFSLILL